MKNCEFIITNEILTDANNEDEFISIFNEKLAILVLLYRKFGGCNDIDFKL